LWDLVCRYKTVFSDVWKIRHTLDAPVREKDEYAFLPAHLELIETPVSRRSHFVVWSILLFVIISLLLSVLGKVEVVSVANGKFTHSGRSKEIKSIENAIVEKIMVKDGSFVKKNDPLVELTVPGVESDILKSEASLLYEKTEQYRYAILSESIQRNELPEIRITDFPGGEDNAGGEHFQRVSSLIKEQFMTWQNRKNQKQLTLNKKIVERDAALARVSLYEHQVSQEGRKLNDFKYLLNKKAVSQHSVMEQENSYIQAKNEHAVWLAQVSQLEKEIELVREELALETNIFRSEIIEKHRKSTDNIVLLEHELEKNRQRKASSFIKAPVSGTVQELNIHTEGGVVTTAETLMIIVPDNDILEVTASVLNKDIGFIQPGQEVVIKVDAYPYTRHGYLTGKVKNITADSVSVPDTGLVFNVIISVDRNDIQGERKKIPVTAGMTVMAEIKTGVRSVISYLLSPLKETINESLRER
ncbi:enterohemolysin T1SS ABC transporter subunit EhxD, partial [Escherichia coli]|nr:enterohemolysin T1SS ABC transporter subunit EhxD [Escherichia coli]